MDNLNQKRLLYKQFAAWTCNSYSTVPVTDYLNNSLYQELNDEDEYDSARSYHRIHLELKASSGYTEEAEKLEKMTQK